MSLISLSHSPATLCSAASEVLLLIWEGQPRHGCRSLAELNAAHPRGADQEIQSRLWDLLPVVRNHVYHPRFGGSFSLKDVLPALVPEITVEARGYATNSQRLRAGHSPGENL
jgi:hypothetical protein